MYKETVCRNMSNAIGSVQQMQEQNLGHQLPYLFPKVQDKEEKAQETTEKDQYWRAFKSLVINSDLTWANEAERSCTHFSLFFSSCTCSGLYSYYTLQIKYMGGVLWSYKILSIFLRFHNMPLWVNHIALASLLAKWSFGIFLLVEYSAYRISLVVGTLCRWFSVEEKQVHVFQYAKRNKHLE